VQRLLPLIFVACLLILAAPSVSSANGQVYDPDIGPERRIFDGKDNHIPKEENYLFAMMVDKRVPKNRSETIEIVRRSVPRWMSIAVKKSSGDQECIVFVNDSDYFGLVVDFFFSRWNVTEENFKEKLFLSANEAPDIDRAKADFQSSLCKVIKTEALR